MPPDEKEPSLLDAVSAGIETLGEPPAPAGDAPDDADTGDDSGAGESTPDGDEGTGEAGDSASGESGDDSDDSGEAAGDDAAGAKGDAKGKKPAEGAAELGPDGKPKQPAAKKEEPKPDPVKERDAHVNGPVDQRLKEGTRNRIQFLANEVKRQDTQLVHADEMLNAIESTGMQPDELATMLGYAHARHKGSAEQKQKAFNFLKGELRAFALEIGAPDVDFLEEHPDLKEAVAANTITAEYAQELALTRSRAATATAANAATGATTQIKQAHAAGVQSLGQMAGALAKRDGDAVFLAKKTTLVAVLKRTLAKLPPNEWAETFKDAYEALPKPVIAAPKPKAPVQNPQRPGTPAGGQGKKEPKSLFEAISSAVDGDAE